MEPPPEKITDRWLDWKTSFQMSLLQKFMQVNYYIDQMEDVIGGSRGGKVAEVKLHQKEISEPAVLMKISDNIQGMEGHPVSDVAIADRKIEVEKQTLNDIVPPFKIWKKKESQKQNKHREERGGESRIYIILGLLSVFSRKKEGERGDIFHNWPWCSDAVGIT